ncbi:MAG: NAD-dependent epimerase/dehydratase [Deltaproteobacteria bacterium]|nr:NAD-dependent epimerase/dehydratase [Deltaproteobacteria bacterium]
MTAFVLGATGFVGREVVRQLCIRGTTTVAHVRPDSGRLEDWRRTFGELGAEVDTSPWDAVQLAAALRAKRPAQLYILIGTTRSKAKSDQVEGDIYEQVDLKLTQLAALAARASEASPRLVYLSSVGADASARSAYLRARGRAEAVVRGAGLPWVIARPSLITGEREDGRLGERSAAVLGDGLLAIASVLGGRSLRSKYRSTTPDILASALIRIGEAPAHDRVVDGADLR